MTKLLPMNELIGAVVIPALSNEDIQAFKTDANSVLASTCNIDIEVDVKLVENSNSDVNLALPYYSEVEALRVEMLKDERLNDISGGEIVISIFVVGGALAGFGLASAAGAGVLTTLAAISVGSVVGGVVGAGVAGTAIAAGVQKAKGKHLDGKSK